MAGLSIFEFALLEDHSKRNYLIERGTFLMSRRAEKCRVHLYELPGFYVEIFVDTPAHSSVWYRSFNEPSLLEPYVNNIHLDGLD
jgi:hypothetical protein